MIARALNALGLMKRAEHERFVGKSFDEVRALCSHLWVRHYKDEAPNWLPLDTLPGVISQLDNSIAGISNALAEERERFKRAATDLAKQAEEIAELKKAIAIAGQKEIAFRNEIGALRPDAEAMRKKRAADRKRMAGKRNG